MTKAAIKQLTHNLIPLLPRGAIKEISEQTGLDRNSVRMILLGVWSNEQVMKIVLAILERQKQQIEQTIAEMAKE